MPFRFVSSGCDSGTLLGALRVELESAQPKVLGVASAYVSVFGVTKLLDIIRSTKVQQCRLLAGVDGEITHPTSLEMAKDAGWNVRLGRTKTGIFHPKFSLGGKQFADDGSLVDAAWLYVGSGNLTRGGLEANVECGMFSNESDKLSSYANLFSTLWNKGLDLTDPVLEKYSTKFARRNRQRNSKDLKYLEVADYAEQIKLPPAELRQLPAPSDSERAIRTKDATVAWAGLQSFTGEYQFQIEFPRAAGEVIQDLVRGSASADIEVECEDKIRTMNFHYYRDNAMFRLNVSLDVPNVDWARQNRDGIAVVSPSTNPGATIRMRILKPGKEMDEIISRSVALGTWGKTPTRLYGWL